MNSCWTGLAATVKSVNYAALSTRATVIAFNDVLCAEHHLWLVVDDLDLVVLVVHDLILLLQVAKVLPSRSRPRPFSSSRKGNECLTLPNARKRNQLLALFLLNGCM
jgi:hypothetical protein